MCKTVSHDISYINNLATTLNIYKPTLGIINYCEKQFELLKKKTRDVLICLFSAVK